MPEIIGYQFATLDGVNVAGEENDPTGGNSWELIRIRDKDYWQEIADQDGWILQPIYEGTVEEPEWLNSPPKFYTVAVYLRDQVYGGPEEGGWYYSCGSRQDDWPPMIAATRVEARRLRRTVQDFLDAYTNVGRRSIYSVLSEGVYEARMYPGYPPTHYPEHRPHYE